MHWKAWRQPDLWPVVSSDYVSLAGAAREICELAYAGRWLKPFDCVQVAAGVPDPKIVFDEGGALLRPDLMENHGRAVLAILDGAVGRGSRGQPDVLQWLAAHSRFVIDFKYGDAARAQRDEALKRFHGWLADGLVVSGYHNDANGQIQGLKKEAWSCTWAVAVERFRSCKINLEDPFYNNGQRTSYRANKWLFVPRGNVDAFKEAWAGQVNDVKVEHKLPSAPKSEEIIQTNSSVTVANSGRGKPKWYPLLVKHHKNDRERRDRAIDNGHEPSPRNTNDELLRLILRDDPRCGAKLGSVKRYRRMLDRV